MNFRVGEKVVYINKRPFPNDHYLVYDKIYTVTRIASCVCGDQLIGIAEVPDINGCTCAICGYMFYRRWYRSAMFRRLITEEILDELLEKNPLTEETPDVLPKKEEKENGEKEKKKEKV